MAHLHCQALCHLNDGLQLSTRRDDLRRLGTAGFVTEFGGVADVATGRAEVRPPSVAIRMSPSHDT